MPVTSPRGSPERDRSPPRPLRIGSRQKWLTVHGRRKWAHYYDPQSIERQRQFFDHFLKQTGTSVPAWPRVSLEVRERANVGEMRAESEWPLARTQYRKLFLDALDGTLHRTPRLALGMSEYEPVAGGRVRFDHRFDADTELTGHMSLRLWVEAVDADDMDLFVALQKLDADGKEVPFIFYAMLETGPVALGWLRVSHRELDGKRSRIGRPVHTHVREARLQAGQIAEVDIEIWPSSTHFAAGEQLRLVIQGDDVIKAGAPNAPLARHEETRNRGRHRIHTGGPHDSHLLIPLIPSLGI